MIDLLMIRDLLSPILTRDADAVISVGHSWLISAALRKMGVRLSKQELRGMLERLVLIAKQNPGMSVDDYLQLSDVQEIIEMGVDGFVPAFEKDESPQDLVQLVNCPHCDVIQSVNTAEEDVVCFFCGQPMRSKTYA